MRHETRGWTRMLLAAPSAAVLVFGATQLLTRTPWESEGRMILRLRPAS